MDKVPIQKLTKYISRINFLFLGLTIFLLSENIYSQEIEFKPISIKTGIGIGLSNGDKEHGMGLVYSIGWQKSYGKNNRFRLNPNMIIGEFLPYRMSEIINSQFRINQFYRITSLNLNIDYDLIKGRSFSIVIGGGGFINYSRGLSGTGWVEVNDSISEYFYSFVPGRNFSMGCRVDPKNSKLAYELRTNFQYGRNDYKAMYFMFGIDFKLKNGSVN